MIEDDDTAGTVFRSDHWIRHPHDLGTVPAPDPGERTRDPVINKPSRHYAGTLPQGLRCARHSLHRFDQNLTLGFLIESMFFRLVEYFHVPLCASKQFIEGNDFGFVEIASVKLKGLVFGLVNTAISP